MHERRTTRFRRKCEAAWRRLWPTRTKAATGKRRPTMASGATGRELVTSRSSGMTTRCDDGGGGGVCRWFDGYYCDGDWRLLLRRRPMRLQPRGKRPLQTGEVLAGNWPVKEVKKRPIAAGSLPWRAPWVDGDGGGSWHRELRRWRRSDWETVHAERPKSRATATEETPNDGHRLVHCGAGDPPHHL